MEFLIQRVESQIARSALSSSEMESRALDAAVGTARQIAKVYLLLIAIALLLWFFTSYACPKHAVQPRR